jgi:hypothetical protein
MKPIRFLSSLLFFLTLLAACGPAAPAGSPSQTHKGITLTVTGVSRSLLKTTVTVVVQAGPEWNLSAETERPAGAMLNNVILTDESGRQYTLHSSTNGFPSPDETTGGVLFENTLTFEPVEDDTLTLQAEVEIMGIPASPPVEIALDGRQAYESWPLDQELALNDFILPPGNVEITYQSDSKLELAFTFQRAENDGLRLTCLHFFPNPPQENLSLYADCTADDTQIVSKLGMDLPADGLEQIVISVTGSLAIIEPFIVEWAGK